VGVDDSTPPVRVDATASTIQELQATLAEESALGLADISEYDFTIWDADFDTYTKFPKTIANVPTKCKVNVKKVGTKLASPLPVPGNVEKEKLNDADTVMLDADTTNTTTTVNNENEKAPDSVANSIAGEEESTTTQ